MDDYPLDFSVNNRRDNVSLPENPGVKIEKTGKSILLEKGRKIEYYQLDKGIKDAIAITRNLTIKTNLNSDSGEERKTLQERTKDDTQSIFFKISQSTDKLYLQKTLEFCDDLIVEYKAICQNKNPLDDVIEKIEERLDILENEEAASNSDTTLIKSEQALFNDKNSNLSKSVEVPISQNNSNKNISTESVKENVNRGTNRLNNNSDNWQARKLAENDSHKIITRVTTARSLLAISQLTTKDIPLKILLEDFLKKSLVDKLKTDKPFENRVKNAVVFLKSLTNKYYSQNPNLFRKSFLRVPKNSGVPDKESSFLSRKINNIKENKEKVSSMFPDMDNSYKIKDFKTLSDGSKPVIHKNAENSTAQADDVNNKSAAPPIDKKTDNKEQFYENKIERELFDQLQDILKKISINNNINNYLEKLGAKDKDLVDDYSFCEKEIKKNLNQEETLKKLFSILKKIIEHELAWKSRDENPCDTSIRLRGLLEKVNNLLDKYKESDQERPSKIFVWLESYREQLNISEKLADKECKNRKIVSSKIE